MAEGTRQEIERRAKEWEATFNRGDMDALAALYTEDGVLVRQNSGEITGRPAIQRFWQGVRDDGFTRVALHTKRVEASGDLAAELGTGELIGESESGQGSTIQVKYVVVWRRHAGGSWQDAVDIWNFDTPV